MSFLMGLCSIGIVLAANRSAPACSVLFCMTPRVTLGLKKSSRPEFDRPEARSAEFSKSDTIVRIRDLQMADSLSEFL